MSSKKVNPITRRINIASYIWAANVLTVTCTAGHGLVATDVVKLKDRNFPEELSAAVVSVSGVSSEVFTVSTTNSKFAPSDYFITGIFNAAATGAQETFSWGLGTPPSGLVQIATNGTGTVTAKVEVSLDGVNWVDLAAQQAIGTGSSYIFEVTKPYVYGRLNFTVAVGGALGKVTAFRVTG